MDFIVLTEELDSKFKQIEQRILRLQSGGTIDSIQNLGVNTKGQIGASFVSLKNLAADWQPDEQLATLLWTQNKREQQIVACFLLPGTTNKEKITQLIQHCHSFEIAEYFGSLFLYRHKDLFKIAQEWTNSSVPYRQTAGITAMARYLILHKEQLSIWGESFKDMLSKDYSDKYVELVAKRYK